MSTVQSYMFTAQRWEPFQEDTTDWCERWEDTLPMLGYYRFPQFTVGDLNGFGATVYAADDSPGLPPARAPHLVEITVGSHVTNVYCETLPDLISLLNQISTTALALFRSSDDEERRHHHDHLRAHTYELSCPLCIEEKYRTEEKYR